MNAKHGAAGHHASAASHHDQAARYHREASRHYETGKDYAHSAHQALLARGHTLQAIDRGLEASKVYADLGGQTAPDNAELVPQRHAEAVEEPRPRQANLNAAEHHAAAANHHEQASRHHSEAAKHGDGSDSSMAAHHGQLAHRHAQYAVFHGDEAARHHVEHYGKSGPTAEIA